MHTFGQNERLAQFDCGVQRRLRATVWSDFARCECAKLTEPFRKPLIFGSQSASNLFSTCSKAGISWLPTSLFLIKKESMFLSPSIKIPRGAAVPAPLAPIPALLGYQGAFWRRVPLRLPRRLRHSQT